MSSNRYAFVSNWYVNASPDLVYDILSNSEDLCRWWPAVYLDVKELEKGQEDGVGKLIALYTKGFLPYSLQWKFRVKAVQKPNMIEIEALGDLIGTGRWTILAEGDGTRIRYDWNIQTSKPLLNRLAWLIKPAFEANHAWAMRKGEESLKLEIRRRNGEYNVPEPSGPTFPHGFRDNKVF